MASKPIERRYVIGYALAPKKQSSFIQVSLIDLARQRGIDLIKIEPSKPLIEQGPFDCILHKLYGHDWEKQLINYSSNFPNAVIIDCPESIKRLHNRISMLQVVSELEIDCRMRESFGIPKQFVIKDVEELSDVRIEREGLKFPVIAKPLVADGSAKSHKMSLVYNDVGLNELKVKPPIVLQEFVNHGGVIFKVYVVGGYVKCVKRKSLADINEENLGSFEGAVSFCQVSNVSSSEKTDHEEYHKLMDLKDIELPPLSLITDIARGLKKATKLHLFNFDVIRDTKVGDRYLVIDINYFPGYAKMPDYERVLTDFFWDVLSKDRRGGVGCFKKPESCDKEVRLLGSSGHSEDGGMVIPVSPLKRDEKEASIQV